jgi:probable F420-dependent oxidoreductase
MATLDTLRLGISLPKGFPGGITDLGYLDEYLARVETSAFEDAWLTESILTPKYSLEPLTYLSFVASRTRRIRLGIAVIILNFRNALQLARAAATIDQLSEGRFILGLGLGFGTAAYPVFGVESARRVSRFEEALRVMQALWSGQEVTLDGQYHKLDRVVMQPAPLQRPHLPVWIGGHSEPAMRRAVRMADGWMSAGAISVEAALEQVRQMQNYLAEAGRERADFRLSKRIYLTVDEDEAAARRKLSESLTRQYGARGSSVGGLAGSPARIVDAIGSLAQAGYDHVLLNPVDDDMRQMEMLVERVLVELPRPSLG